MNTGVEVALLVPVAYLLGTFPSATLVARRRGVDITAEGSGNPPGPGRRVAGAGTSSRDVGSWHPGGRAPPDATGALRSAMRPEEGPQGEPPTTER